MASEPTSPASQPEELGPQGCREQRVRNDALREAAAVQVRRGMSYSDLEAPDPEQGIAMQVRLGAPLTDSCRLKPQGPMKKQAQEMKTWQSLGRALVEPRGSSLRLGACYVASLCLAFLPSEPWPLARPRSRGWSRRFAAGTVLECHEFLDLGLPATTGLVEEVLPRGPSPLVDRKRSESSSRSRERIGTCLIILVHLSE